MTEAIIKEIFSRLDQVAIKLGTTTEKLWAVLVKQGVVEAVMAILYFVLAIIFFVIWSKMVLRVEDIDNDPRPFFVLIPIAAIGLFCIFAAAFNFTDIGYLINPDMYPIDYLRAAFTGDSHHH